MLSNQHHQYDVNQVLASLPNDSYWKLIMDASYWSANDPLFFDKQLSPGYLQNASRALYYNLLTINEPLTLDLIVGLHKSAYHNKLILLSLDNKATSGIGLEATTVEGLEELIQRIKDNRLPFQIVGQKKIIDSQDPDDITFEDLPFRIDPSKTAYESALEIYDQLKKTQWHHWELKRESTLAEVNAEINRLIDIYHQKQAFTNSGDERTLLQIIAEFIRNIHQYHPFGDGNGRTFIFLILNKLLITNGLSPTCIEKPGKFSAHSVAQLVDEILEGQKLFKSLLSEKDQKAQPLLAWLQQKIGETNEDHVFNLFDSKQIRLGYFYLGDGKRLLDSLGINEFHTYVTTKLVEIHERDTIHYFFEREFISPHLMAEIFKQAVRVANAALTDYIINFDYKSDTNQTSPQISATLNKALLDLIMDPEFLGHLYENFDLENIKKWESKLGPLDPFDLLTSASRNIQSNSPISYLNIHFLIINKKADVLIHLLNQLSDQDFLKLAQLNIFSNNRGQLRVIQELLMLADDKTRDYCFDRVKNLPENEFNDVINAFQFKWQFIPNEFAPPMDQNHLNQIVYQLKLFHTHGLSKDKMSLSNSPSVFKDEIHRIFSNPLYPTAVVDDFSRMAMALTPAVMNDAFKKLEKEIEQRLKDKNKLAGRNLVKNNGQQASHCHILTEIMKEWCQQNGFNQEQQIDCIDRDNLRRVNIQTSDAVPVLFDFPEENVFRSFILAFGYLPKDIGSGVAHGEFTHFLQIYAVVEANKKNPFLLHTPQELIKLSGIVIGQTTRQDNNNVSQVLAWDLIFNRNPGTGSFNDPYYLNSELSGNREEVESYRNINDVLNKNEFPLLSELVRGRSQKRDPGYLDNPSQFFYSNSNQQTINKYKRKQDGLIIDGSISLPVDNCLATDVIFDDASAVLKLYKNYFLGQTGLSQAAHPSPDPIENMSQLLNRNHYSNEKNYYKLASCLDNINQLFNNVLKNSAHDQQFFSPVSLLPVVDALVLANADVSLQPLMGTITFQMIEQIERYIEFIHNTQNDDTNEIDSQYDPDSDNEDNQSYRY
ncbi:MAG: Fic family protein [Gammaproteobacteria bacterium]|nr:Fic family protein [Gammaproteobacteria bacterium]